MVFGVRNAVLGIKSDASGLSAHCPGLFTLTLDEKLEPPFVELLNRRPWSSDVLHSSRMYATSSFPFFSTTGTENWLAENPKPPAPGASATTFFCVQTAREGSCEGTESV
jgi:hypothetical protein